MNNNLVSLVKVESAENVDRLKEAVARLLSNLYIPEDFLRGKKVLIKPNLVIPAQGDSPIITNPNLVIAVAMHLKEHSALDVIIAESSLISSDTEQAFIKSGLKKMADAIDVKCVDLKKVEMETVTIAGAEVLHEIEIPKLLSEYQIVNLPKLKTHIQTALTCAVKNLKGLLSDNTKRRVHFLGLHQAIVDFSMFMHPAINIVDAVVAMEGMGAIGGTPVDMKLIFGGVDPYSVDILACELIGYKKGDVKYIELARERNLALGDFSDLKVTGESVATFKKDFQKPTGKLPEVSVITFEDADACSACIHTLSSFISTKREEMGQIERILSKRGEKMTILLGPNAKPDDVGNFHKPIFFGKCTKGICETFPKESAFVAGCPPAMSIDLFEKLIPLYNIDEKKLQGTFFDKVKRKLGF